MARQTRLQLLLLLFAFAVIIFHVTLESAEAVSCGTTNCGLVFKGTCGPCQRCVNRVVFESCEDDATCEPACSGANPPQCDFDNPDARLSQCDAYAVCWQSQRECLYPGLTQPYSVCGSGYTFCDPAYCCKKVGNPDTMCYDNKVYSASYYPTAGDCNPFSTAAGHECLVSKVLSKDCNTGNPYGSCPGTCTESTTSGIIGPTSSDAGAVVVASCAYSACPTPTPTPTPTATPTPCAGTCSSSGISCTDKCGTYTPNVCNKKCDSGSIALNYLSKYSCNADGTCSKCDTIYCGAPGCSGGACATATATPTSTPTPTPVAGCTDTGTSCTDKNGATYTNKCNYKCDGSIALNYLSDYWCVPSGASAGTCDCQSLYCSLGCSGGACKTPTPTPTPPPGACTDTDNNDIYMKGTCTSTTTCVGGCEDRCVDEGVVGGTLDEIYCSGGGKCADRFPSCPAGYKCSNGACVPTPTPTPTPPPTATPTPTPTYTYTGTPVPWSCPYQTITVEPGFASGGGSRDLGWHDVYWDGTGTVILEAVGVDDAARWTTALGTKYVCCCCGSRGPFDITYLFAPGRNSLHVEVYDYICCGSGYWGTRLTGHVSNSPCDGTPPVTTDNSDAAWHNSNVAVALTCTDGVGGSGCASTKYCVDATGTCAPTTVYTGPVTLTSTGYIRYYSVDNAGNTESVRTSNRVKIDATKPVVTISEPTEAATVWVPVRLEVRIYDEGGSGVNLASIKIKKDGALLHTYGWLAECSGLGTRASPYICSWNWQSAPSDMGTHAFVAAAADVAGNGGVSLEATAVVGCASTLDCTIRYGPKNYCSLSTNICSSCMRDQDFYCPNVECMGVDLDCCSTTVSCPGGLYCDLGRNTCYAKRGNFCNTQADCSSESYCSRDAQVCVLRNFLFLKPHFANVKLGTRPVFEVVITDPVNRTATYELSISGTGKTYARFFGTQTKLKVALKAGEAKRIPLHFSAGAAGQFTIEVDAVDSKYYANGGTIPAGIKSHSDAQVTVDVVTTKNPFLVSSPGPSITELAALALLASLFIFHHGGMKK